MEDIVKSSHLLWCTGRGGGGGGGEGVHLKSCNESNIQAIQPNGICEYDIQPN